MIVQAIVTADRVYLLAVPEVSSNPQAGESVWAAAHKLLGKEGLQAAAMARKPTGVMIPTKDHPFVADLCKRIQVVALCLALWP